MNKAVLIDRLVEKTGVSKKIITQVLDGFEQIIISTLQHGDFVSLTGFGKFTTRRRHARMGVDPRHPEQRIQVPEVMVPKFTSGKTLKDSVNQRT